MYVHFWGETRMKIKIDRFERGVFRAFEKKIHIDQLLQINKMIIKIVIFHGNFQLLEKDVHISSFWDRPE